MLMRFKHAVVVVMLLALSVGAFAGGGAVYRMVRRNDQSQSLALYGSVLRIAGRSPLSAPPAKLSKQTDLRPVDLFLKVEGRLRAHYYEKIEDDTRLAFGTADGMLDSLNDPYSRFLEPEQVQAYLDRQRGIYAGIGAVLGVRKYQAPEPTDPSKMTEEDKEAWPTYGDPEDANAIARKPDGTPLHLNEVYVISTMPGSPAEQARIQPGDAIRKVNGKLIFRRNLDSLDAMLLTARDGSVRLSITRPGVAKPIDLTVPLRETRVVPVSARVDDGVGVITVRTLGPGVADQVRAKARELLAARVNGIVLDLRRNGDGDYAEACALASAFVSGGTVAVVKEQGGKMVDVPAEGSETIKTPRLAALVDNTTSGPAEVLAAAIKARGAGRLLGTTTHGRVSRQELFRMPGGTAVLLTTGL
ncbi:MAG: PDZ domain-containing protein, partial [Armatimonadetes bacterium]|nr:PDZ domain-containing protein [Armatimonadota bacterium]